MLAALFPGFVTRAVGLRAQWRRSYDELTNLKRMLRGKTVWDITHTRRDIPDLSPGMSRGD